MAPDLPKYKDGGAPDLPKYKDGGRPRCSIKETQKKTGPMSAERKSPGDVKSELPAQMVQNKVL